MSVIFAQVGRGDDAILLVDADQSAVKRAVQVGAQGQSVGNLVVAVQAKRFNVAGINQGMAKSAFDAQAGNAASVVIYPGDQFFK